MNKPNTNNNMQINTQSAMNQMNQYMMNISQNNLYNQNIQSTWQNMQINTNMNLLAPNEINLNNMTNILSLINLPIVVPCHNQHPLINCKTPGRAEISKFWICNNCRDSYSYSVPSFYCTACDYDLCQRCFLCLSAFMIAVYNYQLGNMYASQQFTNMSHYHQNIHNHPIVKIIKEPSFSEIQLKCNFCYKALLKNEAFHYCTLCNFCVCSNCFNMNQMPKMPKFVDNPEYLSNNQMNPK
jgi:hypothetical protein